MTWVRSFARKCCAGWILAGLIAAGWPGDTAGADAPLQIWVSSTPDLEDYQEMVRRYQAQVDPAFEAEVRAFGFREMVDKLFAAMQTGIDTPDLVQLDENLFGVFLADEAQIPFVDLTERVRSSGLADRLPPQRLALFTYNGRVYGVPQSLSMVLLFYRADRFEELGIDPEEIDTWEKFVAVGRSLETDEMMTVLDHSHFQILLRQRGGDVVDAAGNLAITDELAVDTLSWLLRLAEDGLAFFPARSTIFDPVFLTLEGENVLIIMAPEWYGLDFLKGLAPHLEGRWRAMPLPAWTDELSQSQRRTSSYGGQGLLIYSRSAQAEAAWNFIDFVLNDVEGSVARFVHDNAFPAFMPAWDDPRLFEPDPYFGGQAIGALMVELADELPFQRQHPYQAGFLNLWDRDYWPALAVGRMSAAEALQAIEETLTGGW